ncbi:hypothetical protein [Dyadobacter frigoris]|uniref:Uncharacterized protein n=1 Tax=Dyadobacter frigoris TaxID=2576211 RepID=A0A4U6D7H3_9BACT|nr:hypothetical protein [Dyadobacter frigoris]TKT93389.1 hypothetical protein FDK13_05930 [Dyadobacter frigoris]GLU54702.1 hypothetical protein Dfri01_41630 [Dyadobacter frigoris]
MLPRKLLTIVVLLSFAFTSHDNCAQVVYHFKAIQANKSITIASLSDWPVEKTILNKNIDSFQFQIILQPKGDYLYYEVKASSTSTDSLFLALEFEYKKGTAMNFNGPVLNQEIYRQSVHDPTNYFFRSLPRQSIPMIAVNSGDSTFAAISDAPAFYNNFTTQYFNPDQRKMYIGGGDNGQTPGNKVDKSVIVKSFYPIVAQGKQIEFNGLIMRSKTGSLSAMRQDIFKAISERWGSISTKFGATAFASNYMLYRTNEIANSKYWVVAGIDYCNKQYTRDSFWQTMVLSPEMEQQSYLHEAQSMPTGAERQLIVLIWAYRLKKKGGTPDLNAARKNLEYIEKRVSGARYKAISSDDPENRKNFKSWFDLCMFEDDDVISYNQGLLAVALHAASELGLRPSVKWQDAAAAYRNIFYKEGGYFPISEQKKDIVAVDATIGDLLHMLLFNSPLLEKEQVASHFMKVSSVAKTDHGFKIVCMPDGSYVPSEKFDIPGFVSPHAKIPVGDYANGGSYYLYDMLFLINAYVRHIPGAAELLIWRGTIDFKREGAYYEHLNTVSGKPGKINQGWNGAIYAIMHAFEKNGVASDILTKEIEQIP